MGKKNYMEITIYIACPILVNYCITQTKTIFYDSTFRRNLSFPIGKNSVSVLKILVAIVVLTLLTES